MVLVTVLGKSFFEFEFYGQVNTINPCPAEPRYTLYLQTV